jgi:predicted ATPase
VFLARQLHDAAALVIGTYRDVEVTAGDHPARPLLAELAGQAELIRLTGLAADEVGQLIEKVCGEHPQAPLIQAVHDRTAGNPFSPSRSRGCSRRKAFPWTGPRSPACRPW